jgi:hypothetical protein
MKLRILAIPCNGLAGIFKIGRLSLTSVRRLVFAIKFTLQTNPAKNTMPAKSLFSVSSVTKQSIKSVLKVKKKHINQRKIAKKLTFFCKNKPNFRHFSPEN